VLLSAVNSLKYKIVFESKKGLRWTNTYPNEPLKVSTVKTDKKSSSYYFQFSQLDNEKFELYINDEKRIYKFDQVIIHENLQIKVQRPLVRVLNTIRFKYLSTPEFVNQIRKSLKVDDSQANNILSLRYSNSNIYLSADILNAILASYLKFDKDQREISLTQTSKFITSLSDQLSLKTIASSVALQKFKEVDNDIISPLAISHNVKAYSDLNEELKRISIAEQTLKFVYKDLTKGIPDRLSYDVQDIPDVQLQDMTSKYQDLVIKRNHLLKQYTISSKFVTDIDQEIEIFRNSITNNLLLQHKLLTEKGNLIRKTSDSIQRKLSQLPNKERLLGELQSRFDVDRKVYNYLSEKKLEAEIARAAVIPGAVIIDKADYPEEPNLPLPVTLYTSSALFGLAGGITFIFLKRKINPFVNIAEDILQHTITPVLATLRRSTDSNDLLSKNLILQEAPRSLFSESLRSLRSNLFSLINKDCNMICITSEISGEGKSLISKNLAYAFAITGKKVILVDADLRKPKLHESFNTGNQMGLTNYIHSDLALEQIIRKTSIENLEFIPSGPLPINPSELLENEKIDVLINSLKRMYDIIIFDSAPVGIVTDSTPILKKADINLFILRCGVSRQEYINTPEAIKQKLMLDNIYIVFNDFLPDNFFSHYNKSKQILPYPNGYYSSYYQSI
ncbi:MAG: polysaccharide biosynthesis tyrosine autokinase, partial [Flavobacterium sp.]